MGLRRRFLDWLQAGSMRKEPERQTEIFPYAYGFRRGNDHSTPKKTPANLRLLSESPIPRRAINVIKDGITKLNWSVAAIDENETETYKDICKIIERTLLKPNASDTFRTWIEQMVEDMLVCSAGASEKLRSSDPLRPFRLYPVDAFSIEIFPNWDGKPSSYRFAQRVNGSYVKLMDSELMYIRMNPRTHTPFGLSPLETVWDSVQSFINAHQSAGRQVGHASVRKVLNVGKNVTAENLNAFRSYWRNEVQGRGQVPIIGGDSPSVLDLGATDDRALYIEWQRFLIEVVAIAFGISPKKLGQTKDVNRSTADSEDDDTNATIQTIAESIVEHINNEIIDTLFNLGGVIEFKFHYGTSLKDQKLKAEIDAIYLDRSVDTIDEVRDSRGKKALPNGYGEAIYSRQLTYIHEASSAPSRQQEKAEQVEKPKESKESEESDPSDDTV